MPSCNVARDIALYRDVLGGEVVLWYHARGGQSGGEDMEFKSGDRVQVESESTERPPRTGVVEEVVQGTAYPRVPGDHDARRLLVPVRMLSPVGGVAMRQSRRDDLGSAHARAGGGSPNGGDAEAARRGARACPPLPLPFHPAGAASLLGP